MDPSAKATIGFVLPACLVQSAVAKREMGLRAGGGRKRMGWD